ITREPARDRGRNMLMLDRDFHAYVPNLKRSMRLSLAQKLSGQVANGDISRTRWYGDYQVQVEKTSGGEHQLLLKAKKENLTYAWIRLWLDQKTNKPLRAEYLALNGKTVLKKAWFEDYRMLAGAERPGTIRIEDTSGSKSFIRVQSMQARKFPDSHFTVRNMESVK
ncbi:MAG: outer membrane lipoprotein-sorting protein, partial [Bdellovibrionaceae bacterium]|nr:outer membrane lipoprotein-sorting protein [Pseudobdellovibrionaceae bacterium]